MKKVLDLLALFFLAGLILLPDMAKGQISFVSGENPIFRNSFTADPAPLVHNGRLYVYVGKDEAKDGEMFTMTAWLCYSTTDMTNWTYHGPVMTPTDFSWGARDAWAAQVVERNGKFYLYVTVTGNNPYGGRNIGVAVSDSPTGPFVDARGTPLIRDNMTNNGKVWDDIDPTVLIDDDGQAYLCWGNPICYLTKLKPNMTEIDGEIKMITPPNYAEGPWLHKRNGLYYLTYPAFVAPVGSEQICYATATNINGPWIYRGILTGTARNSYTIHPGIIEFKGQWYLFIHNATLTLNGQGPALGRRSVTVEYLCYNADGTMKPVTQTTAGITVPSPCPPIIIPQGPYNGTWHVIPGTIQLEHYDVGGNGFAYMDSSPGSETAVTFRADEDVDLENCTDVGAGYNIGYGTAGEWLEYSVEVQKPGTYDLDLRVACSGDGRTLSASMDGEAIATDIAIPNTAGWQTWQTVTVKDINLKAGKQVLRVTIGASDYVNMNYVTFTLTKELEQEPYNATAHQVPGRIEAEHYDQGGEGLAYHEANANGNEGGATIRNDEVDIETTQDVDGGYNVGYILQGEWLEYTINLPVGSTYTLDLRMAADGAGKTMHVEVDGVNATGPVAVPNTGGWQTWQTVTVDNMNLTSGEHVIRLAFDSDYMNLNYIEFRDVITGLNSKESNQYNLFPNPFSSISNLETAMPAKFSISSISGVILESGICDKTCTIGENLPEGMYLVKLEFDGRQEFIKLIKR